MSLRLRGVDVLVDEGVPGIPVEDNDEVVLGVVLGVERGVGVILAVPPKLRVVVGVGLDDIVVDGV